MTILERINNLLRGNTNPSPVIDEALYSEGLAYVDPLVFRGYNNFLNKIDKRASMYQDPIINTLTLGWASVATAKTFKFYDSHEVDGVEIMQDYRAWWMQNNLDELLKSLIPHLCMDGWVLLDLYIADEEGTVGYDVYGSFECDTIHWKRDLDNTIIHYNVKFIPFPSPHGWAYGSSYCKAVDKEYDPGELLHFTRGDWNYGVGRSRIGPAWDPAIKLRIGSYADFFRRDLRFIVAVPEGWKKGRVKKFADAFNDMMRGSRRMFIYKMEQSKDPSKTPLELPRFGLESLARPAPKPSSQSEAGGELLRDPEWARLLSAVRLTENYFIGNQAGAVTGSEVDLTRDFYTECEEFGLYEPIIKQIINWFVMMGAIPPPPQDYVVKYWKDWEHIEKAAALAEQEMQQWEQQQGKMVAEETKRKELRQQTAYQLEDNYNEWVNDLILECFRTNMDTPGMIPVSSTWISHVGVQGKRLWVKIPNWTGKGKGPYAGYEFESNEEAFQAGKEMQESGSRGAYMWDNIWAGGGKGPRPTQAGINENITGIHYSNNPFGADIEHPFAGEGRSEEQIGLLQEGTFQERQKGLLQPPQGFLGTESTRRPLIQTSFQQETKQKQKKPIISNPSSVKAPAATIQDYPVYTAPKQDWYSYSLKNSAPKLNSQAYIKQMADKIGWNMSNSTAQKIMQLVDLNQYFNTPRFNSIVVGNPMDFDTVLRYPDNPQGERACKEAWKRINAHEGDLYLYEDLAHGGKRYNVGTYKYWWDDTEERPIVQYNKEQVYEKIEKLLNSWGVNNSNIQMKINSNMAPDLSTEYYCIVEERDGEKYQTNFHNRHGEPVFEGIAIVNRGNCAAPACKYEIIDDDKNATMRENRWITKHGRHIWIKDWYTPEELNKYDPKTGAGIMEVEPWLRIDRNVNLGEYGLNLGYLNRVLETFPLDIKKMINEIRIFNHITEHPSMWDEKGKVPLDYKKVGWTKTYDDIGGVYIPIENNAYLKADVSGSTLRHELGHAVWYGLTRNERAEFYHIWQRRKGDLYQMAWDYRLKADSPNPAMSEYYKDTAAKYEYYANDVEELFADSFQNYYSAMRPASDWETFVSKKQYQIYPEIADYFKKTMRKYEKD
jgi:hypothetical protein